MTEFWNHHLTGGTVVSILLFVLCWSYSYRAWILTFGKVITNFLVVLYTVTLSLLGDVLVIFDILTVVLVKIQVLRDITSR